METLRRGFVFMALMLGVLSLHATDIPGAASDSLQSVKPRITEHRWLFGLWGRQNLLDTYLSPLTYKGTTHGTLHRTERPARWGKDFRTIMQMSSGFVYAHSPTDDAKELDFQLTLGGGVMKSWAFGNDWRVAVGSLVQGSGGFTYHIANGNNPVQARLALEVVPTASAECSFKCLRRTLKARMQVDAPLFGAMFTPHYGQSYYEIFSLGQRDRNIRLTTPFSAPSARLLATLDFPLRGATLTLGYHADVRQSHVNSLKRHSWSNILVVGFVRHVKRVKNPARP